MKNHHLNNVIGSDTRKWYQSRLIYLGVAQILWGVFRGEFEWISTGITTIFLRINTKKQINLKKQ